MSTSPTLHIVCPTQQRGFAAFMSACFVALLAYGLRSGMEHDLTLPVILYVACSMSIVVLAAGALYRNFIFRDALYIARDGDLPSTIELTFLVDDIRIVRLLPAPEAWSPEAKWEKLGFGHGRIEIVTASRCYRFGAGLDERGAQAALERIDRFCREEGALAVAA